MKNTEKMGFNALFFLLFLSQPSFPQGSSVSSGTFGSTSLNLLLDKKQDDSGFYVNYSLRWDFKDLKKAYLFPAFFYRDAVNLDLRKNVKLRYYGYRISPFKFVISERKTDISGSQGSAPPAGGATPRKRKFKLSFSPLYDDLEENANVFLLDNSFKSLSPGWAKLSREEKKTFIRDVMTLGVWDYPVMKEVSDPLERISD